MELTPIEVIEQWLRNSHAAACIDISLEKKPCPDCSPASRALENMKALVEELGNLLPKITVYEAVTGQCFTCGANEHHAHTPMCNMVKARNAYAKFQVEPEVDNVDGERGRQEPPNDAVGFDEDWDSVEDQVYDPTTKTEREKHLRMLSYHLPEHRFARRLIDQVGVLETERDRLRQRLKRRRGSSFFYGRQGND